MYDLDERNDALVNGKAGKFIPVPQKSLPDLPPHRTVSDHTNMRRGTANHSTKIYNIQQDPGPGHCRIVDLNRTVQINTMHEKSQWKS